MDGWKHYRMSRESKRLGSVGCHLNIPHLLLGYAPFNHLLNSWVIQVQPNILKHSQKDSSLGKYQTMLRVFEVDDRF